MDDMIWLTIGIALLVGAPVMIYITLRSIITGRAKAAGLAFLIFLTAVLAVPTDAAIYVVLAAYAAPLGAWIIKRLNTIRRAPDPAPQACEEQQPTVTKPPAHRVSGELLDHIARRNAENVASARGKTVAPSHVSLDRLSVNPLDELRERPASSPSAHASTTKARSAAPWRGNKRITFEYVDSKGDFTTRDVNAVRVEHKNSEVYLVGYDMTRRATRRFRVDRIMSDIIDMETGEVGSFDDIFR